MNGTFTHKKTHTYAHKWLPTSYNPIDFALFGVLLQFLSHVHTWILFQWPRVNCFFLSFECMYSLSLSNLSFIKYATCWPGEAQFVIHYLTPEPSLSSNAFSQWADSGYMHCCMLLHPCAIIHIFKVMLMVTNPQIIITQICSSPQHYRAF